MVHFQLRTFRLFSADVFRLLASGPGALDRRVLHISGLVSRVFTRNEPPFSGDGEYGLGWQIGKYRNEKVVYHHGSYPGYRSHLSFMPERKVAVGVLVNNDALGGRLADMLAAYASSVR